MLRYGWILLVLIFFSTTVAGQLTVSYIDVGQGDSQLLQSGSHNMLIDAGPVDAGPTVVNYLKTHGVTNLDVVVATNPQEEHIGGMVDVLNAFPVGLYVDNGESTASQTYVDVKSLVQKKQIPYTEVKTGKTIPFVDGIPVEVLNPTSDKNDLYEDSVVLKVTDGSEKFLFMGDSSTYTGDPSAQILKVTNHGSKSGSSLSFLELVNPKVAVIDVGAGNTLGYPAQKTLENLNNVRAEVYRTDRNGNIVVTSTGSSYSVTSDKGTDSSTSSNQTKSATPLPAVVS